MTWFGAMLLFVAKMDGEAPSDTLFKDSLRVFRARDAAHAAVCAETVGRAADQHSQSMDGRTVRWTFLKVIEVLNLNEDVLEDGAEVFWIWEEREAEDGPTPTDVQVPRRAADTDDVVERFDGSVNASLPWFCALIFSACQVDGQSPSVLAESYRVFRARDMAHAIGRADEVGRLEEADYLNYLNETVRWTFQGVDEIQALGVPTLEDGVEAFAILHRGAPEDESAPADPRASESAA